MCMQIRRRLLEFVLAAFQRSPNFIALLKVMPSFYFPYFFFVYACNSIIMIISFDLLKIVYIMQKPIIDRLGEAYDDSAKVSF